MTASLFNDDVSASDGCAFCREASLAVGAKTVYGSIVVYTIGNALHGGWFATLSPKTGGDPACDFTLQLMPCAHLTHFSQMSRSSALEKNFGIAFARLSAVLTVVMHATSSCGGSGSDVPDLDVPSVASLRDDAVSVAIYGKSTNWKEKKEHLHIKMFPFRGALGQPSTVDSTFEKKEVFTDARGERFVKMEPVVKRAIPALRLEELSQRLITYLNKNTVGKHIKK